MAPAQEAGAVFHSVYYKVVGKEEHYHTDGFSYSSGHLSLFGVKDDFLGPCLVHIPRVPANTATSKILALYLFVLHTLIYASR